MNPSVEEFHFEDEVVFVCHPGKLANALKFLTYLLYLDQMNVQNSVYSVSIPMPSEELDNCQMDGDNDEPYANENEAKNINSIEIHISGEEDN